MGTGQFDELKSTQCVCGTVFSCGEDKAKHVKNCQQYQDLIKDYLTVEKLTKLVLTDRYNKKEIFSMFPYNMICLCDWKKFFKQHKQLCQTYIIVNDGSRMTLDEIKSLLSYEYLYDRYVLKQMGVIKINEELGNKFTPCTLLSWIKRRGIKTRNPSEAAKLCVDDCKRTCLERFGVDNALKSKEIQEKIRQTCLSHFGTTHHFKNKEVLKKRDDNIKKMYDVDNVSQLKFVQERKEKTFQNHYGMKNIFCDKDRIKKIIQEKYHTDNVSKLDWVKVKKFQSMEKTTENGVAYSKISVELFDKISKMFPETVNSQFKYATHNGEEFVILNDDFYSLDFSYCDENNNRISIEFNGDLWHANPNKYKSTDCPIFEDKTITAQQIWNRDAKKQSDLTSNGFKTLVVWESDYLQNKDQVVQDCVRFIQENVGV